jgi:DNA-directed RNA polymerase specialized sigma24 family protein
MANNTDAQFESLYRAHARDVHGYFLRRTSSEEAKDATSEVFVVAWRRFDDVPQDDEALPWLYGVARNVLANNARSLRRRDRLAARAAANHDPLSLAPNLRSFGTRSMMTFCGRSRSYRTRTRRSSVLSNGKASAATRWPRCSS